MEINLKRSLPYWFGLASTLLSASCGDSRPTHGISKLKETEISSSSTVRQSRLGQGYSTKDQKFMGDCVIGTREYSGMQFSTVQFDRAYSSSEVSDQLGFSAGASARYGLISGDGSASFAAQTTSSSYSESISYIASYNFKSALLANPKLSETGTNAANSAIFNEACGDEFVDQIRLGAAFFLNLKLEFADASSKDEFKAKFSVNSPVFSARAELEKASQSFTKKGTVTISAYQLGGNVSQISGIFGGSSGSNQVLPIISCSISQMTACLEALNAAIDYATNVNNPKNFPAQINFGGRTEDDPSGPAVLKYLTKPYVKLGVNATNPILEETVKIARQTLAEYLEENLKYRSRLKGLLNPQLGVETSQYGRFSDMLEKVKRNLVLIKEGADICYGTSAKDQCVPKVTLIGTALTKYLESDFAQGFIFHPIPLLDALLYVNRDRGFESQKQQGTLTGAWAADGGSETLVGADVAKGYQASGKNNAYLLGRNGWTGFHQFVQVLPFTNYHLEAKVRSSSDIVGGYFGVRNSANHAVHQEIRFGPLATPGYQTLIVDFNSGNLLEAELFIGIWNTKSGPWLQVDDFQLTAQ